MESVNTLLLLSGLLLFISVLASTLSARLGLPLLLIFLAVGMLAGEDGPGGIIFNDYRTSFLVGNLALAIILLDGGLSTLLQTFRVGLSPALTLATFGVLATAALLGAFASWLLDEEWRNGLLLGAIVGSTDAAAVFSLLRHSGVSINERVRATLEIESGSNDPMAIFLVIVLVEMIAANQTLEGSWLFIKLVQQFGIGAAGGLFFGYVLAELLVRIRLVEGLYALLIASGGLFAFALINQIGGSGFLGIYLLGLVIGNRRTQAREHVLRIMDGLAWLSQAGMFLILGLLVTPSHLRGEVLPALAITGFLTLVARPVAVVLSLLPFRFPFREVAYISWVGLRGAVPIVLSLFPIMAEVGDARRLFDLTFVVVLTSLLAQGATVKAAARWLGVQVPRSPEPIDRKELRVDAPEPMELLQFVVERGAPLIGCTPQALNGAHTRCVAVGRNGELLFPETGFVFAEHDQVFVIAPSSNESALAQQFGQRPVTGPFAHRVFFGPFLLEGAARLADVAAIYGVSIAREEAGLTLDAFLRRRLHEHPVVGDSIPLGALRLTVKEIEDGRVRRVGLKLSKTQ
jgi:cell volume regulation protein A